jgi:hypothetical protein
MSSHRVRTHRWKNGVLQTLDHFFENLDQANLFFGEIDAHTVKMYDDSGDLINQKTISVFDNYSSYSDAEDYSGADTLYA